MRILILGINYWPEVTGIGAFTTHRAEYLASVGHEVEVCAAFPYYPAWKIHPAYAGRLAQSERRNGVSIHRSYAYIPKHVTALKRVLHEASFIASSAIQVAIRKRPDVLYVVSPPLGLAVTAVLLKRLWRIPYVFDVEDLQPDSAADLGMLPKWAVRLLCKVEEAAYRHAGMVTTLTVGMKKRILSKGIAADKVELVEPCMDESLLTISAEEGVSFRQRYGLEDKFLVTHSGNMGIKQGLDVVIDAAVLNRRDPRTLFLLVGDGAERGRIRRRVEEKKLKNIRFLPLLSEIDFRGLLSASEVCLVTQQASVSEIAFPSKLVTYLSAGCAVIASVNSESEVARVIWESGAGLTVNAGDPAALVAAIEKIKLEDQKALSRNGRKYAIRRWSSSRILDILEKGLRATATGTTAALAQESVVQ